MDEADDGATPRPNASSPRLASEAAPRPATGPRGRERAGSVRSVGQRRLSSASNPSLNRSAATVPAVELGSPGVVDEESQLWWEDLELRAMESLEEGGKGWEDEIITACQRAQALLSQAAQLTVDMNTAQESEIQTLERLEAAELEAEQLRAATAEAQRERDSLAARLEETYRDLKEARQSGLGPRPESRTESVRVDTACGQSPRSGGGMPRVEAQHADAGCGQSPRASGSAGSLSPHGSMRQRKRGATAIDTRAVKFGGGPLIDSEDDDDTLPSPRGGSPRGGQSPRAPGSPRGGPAPAESPKGSKMTLSGQSFRRWKDQNPGGPRIVTTVNMSADDEVQQRGDIGVQAWRERCAIAGACARGCLFGFAAADRRAGAEVQQAQMLQDEAGVLRTRCTDAEAELAKLRRYMRQHGEVINNLKDRLKIAEELKVNTEKATLAAAELPPEEALAPCISSAQTLARELREACVMTGSLLEGPPPQP